jgi:hypothetical protein
VTDEVVTLINGVLKPVKCLVTLAAVRVRDHDVHPVLIPESTRSTCECGVGRRLVTERMVSERQSEIAYITRFRRLAKGNTAMEAGGVALDLVASGRG